MASATSLSLTSASSALVNKCSVKNGVSLNSPSKAKLLSSRKRVVVRANAIPKKEEQSLAVVNSLAMVAAMVIPEMAEAAAPGVSPSLKNFLLSIISGGVVLTVIGVAVIGVSNFDPVKRT